jgi:serine/threonine-protein kinase RsbT
MRVIATTHPGGALASDSIPLCAVMPIESRSDGLVAASVALDATQRRGVSRRVGHRVALVVGELATNVYKHGGGGSIDIAISPERVLVRAFDRGPGMHDAPPSNPGIARVVGPFPGGWGLEVVARAADLLECGRDGAGRTCITATLWRGGARR